MHSPVFNTRISDTLAVTVYGLRRARDLTQQMAQGYCVWKNNQRTPRSELTEEERKTVQDYLNQNWPEHAQI